MDSIATTTEHQVRIEIGGIYRFTSINAPVYQNVLITFYNGEVVIMKTCDNLEVILTMPTEVFLDMEPIMVDRL